MLCGTCDVGQMLIHQTTSSYLYTSVCTQSNESRHNSQLEHLQLLIMAPQVWTVISHITHFMGTITFHGVQLVQMATHSCNTCMYSHISWHHYYRHSHFVAPQTWDVT